MIQHGCDAEYLSKNGRDKRIDGMRFGDPYYEPITKIRRLFVSRKLPLRMVVWPGLRLRFLGSLRHEILGVGGGIASTLVKAFDAATGSTCATESMFFGYVDRPSNPAATSFPFDTWLTMESFDPIA